MQMIVGLGNPGEKYARTRHNAGFMVVDALAGELGPLVWRERFQALTVKVEMAGKPVLLVKPQTYMNLSGSAVAALLHWYKIELDNLLVIYDDLDLPPGKIRLRTKGGSGGHKGMISIIDLLGTSDFPRLRVGIGRPPVGGEEAVIAWVLGEFAPEERPLMEEAVRRGAAAARAVVEQGLQAAMNLYNR
ncbi:aminoacyl-tRNA hydrolase [Desulfurispora thermophila]|uniref:aminoacyl-tRNA hydrolase n=1 Tax=Desulfurispora thermophila TaxID=265470 RepID=UPI00037A2EEB|nr:aminoacyl-tRNA hydrolase [Desulfurispora thermophila]